MLRARLDDGTFVLGIDAENVRRLKRGQPILIYISELGGADDVRLFFLYGDTLQDIQNALKGKKK